jgi:L-aspartate oxidase
MARRYLTEVRLTEQTPLYDVVILGAGVSGLYLAAALPQTFKTLVLSKESLETCNSQLAQGGVALTLDGTIEGHIEDTLAAGAYLNDLDVVRDMVGESEAVLNQLIAYGIEFDKDEGNKLSMTREGGHRTRRIVHSRDTTGMALMETLTRQVLGRPRTKVTEYAFAVDLITDDSGIRGVSYSLNGEIRTVAARIVVLATGGIGGWFSRTTNAPVVTGDGLAMALRAGVVLRDAAYIQYHPTAFRRKKGGYFLISEAVRGEGGLLINERGERFLKDAHPLMELAPRDVVSKAIHEQLQHGSKVYVDVRQFEPDYFASRFPNIYRVCLENDIDPLTMPIPVEPVEHYHMGGVMADSCGSTGLPGLYVTGEAAGTGFHGANRLASNSLLECMALSERIVRDLEKKGLRSVHLCPYLATPKTKSEKSIEIITRSALRKIFDTALPLVKHEEALALSLEKLKVAFDALAEAELTSNEDFEIYNGLQVAKALILDALSIKKSVGSFVIE